MRVDTPQLIAIRRADVFAPRSLGVRDLLIGGGSILWLGDELPADVARLATTVDAGGRRLIPGLIDCHVHATGGGGEQGFASRVAPLRASDFTRAGVTSLVGLLGTDDTTRDTASLLAAVRGLGESGLGAWCLTGGYRVPPQTLTGSVRDDIVHIDRIIGVGEIAISDHRSSQPTLDELLRIASDAYVSGMLSGKAGIVHLHLGDGTRGLELVRCALAATELPPRVFHPTHVNRNPTLFDDALELCRSLDADGRTGFTIDVTAFPSDPSSDDVSAVDAIRRYFDSGLPRAGLTVSSDAGGSLNDYDAHGNVIRAAVGRPSTLTDTLVELLRSGSLLDEVLPAFTSNVAGYLKLSAKGAIAVGHDADLSLLDDDGRPIDVMVGGYWHVRDGVLVVRDRFADPSAGGEES